MPKTCATCGSPLDHFPRCVMGKRRFCNMACRRSFKTKSVHICKGCGKDFVAYNSRRQQFCTQECRAPWIEVGCSWKDCVNKVAVHKIKCGYYKDRRQGVARYVLCEEHESLVFTYLGKYRLSGLFRLFKRDCVWCYRSLSSQGLRLFLWDRAGRKCEACGIEFPFS